jgi:hypothetical protein
MGHQAKWLSSSRAREYCWVDIVEAYVRLLGLTAEELDLLHWGTDIVHRCSCALT